MSRTQIIQSKFHAINRDVKAAVDSGSYNAAEIGRRHHVSRETVNAVRRAGTWPQWLRNKAESNRRRVERARAAAHASLQTPEGAVVQKLADTIADVAEGLEKTWTKPSLQAQLDQLTVRVIKLERKQRRPFNFFGRNR